MSLGSESQSVMPLERAVQDFCFASKIPFHMDLFLLYQFSFLTMNSVNTLFLPDSFTP